MANHDILLAPFSYIGCLCCLSDYKKDTVKGCYLQAWKKSHGDSQLKTRDNPKFMEAYGYAFRNLKETVEPLLNPGSQNEQIEKLNWQFIWNYIIGFESTIMADSMEPNILKKYIRLVDGIQTGPKGEKFPVGYLDAQKSYLDALNTIEKAAIDEASKEITYDEKDNYEASDVKDKDLLDTVVVDDEENEVVSTKGSKDNEKDNSTIYDASYEKDKDLLDTVIVDEEDNEVVSLDLDDNEEVSLDLDDNEEVSLDLDEGEILNTCDEVRIDDCKRKVDINIINSKKMKTVENLGEKNKDVRFDCGNFDRGEVASAKLDLSCENELMVDRNDTKEDEMINTSESEEEEVFNRNENEAEEMVNIDDKEEEEIEKINNDCEAFKSDQKKRSLFSWKNVRKNAVAKGEYKWVSEIDDGNLIDGCFLMVDEDIKHGVITKTRNWGKGFKLSWKGSKGALGYNCKGSQMCSNDSCEYLRVAKYCKTMDTKRNIYYWSDVNGEEVCSYCESNQITFINCTAKLLIVTTMSAKKEIFQCGHHSCFKKHMDSKLPEDFKEKMKTDDEAPRATEDKEILKMVRNGKSKNEIISKASQFISSGKHGSERKYNQVTKELGSKQEQLVDARKAFSKSDPLIIEQLIFGSKEPKIFGTSEEMLELALSMDSDISQESDEYVHQDGVHSYLREGKMLAMYAIHPLLKSIVRIAWLFCSTENAENISFLWMNFNRIFAERKKKLSKDKKAIEDFKFKPYGVMTDCHGSNANGLIQAGYDPEWVKRALRNCLSHFQMRVEFREKEVLKSHGQSKAVEFRKKSWKWQGSCTEEGAFNNFEEWKSLCDDVGQGKFCLWWNNQRMFIVQAFRGVYTPKSNLSECYQSGLCKGLSIVQAVNNQGVASVRIAVRLAALSQGSRNVKGQTPTATVKRMAKERSDANYTTKVLDEVENVIIVDEAGGSGRQCQQEIPPEDQRCGPTSSGNSFGRRPKRRNQKNQVAEKSLKFLQTWKWTVISVTDDKKIFKLRRGNTVVSVNISTYPSCNCTFWKKSNESGDQTCADIMHVLNNLFQVPIDDNRIYQVMFKDAELRLLRSQYKPPTDLTPDWGSLTDFEVQLLFEKESAEKPVWKLGRTKAVTTAKCRGCSKVLDHNQVVIYADGLALINKSTKPIANRFYFCVNAKCPKKLPYTNLSAPESFKLVYNHGGSVLSNEEISKALELINVDLGD